jgi:hypothetical protein
MFGRRKYDFLDAFYDIGLGGGSRYTLDGDVDRSTFACVSDRAMRAQDNVRTTSKD